MGTGHGTEHLECEVAVKGRALTGSLKNFANALLLRYSKNPWIEDQALVIPRGDLLRWNFIDILKFQISNPKYQTNFNDQNSK